MPRDNLLLGGIEVLIWLYLCPSRWTAWVREADPDMRGDFGLIDLRERATTRALRRVVTQLSIAMLVLAPALTVCLGLFATTDATILAASALYALILSIAGTTIVSMLVSVPAALSGSIVMGPAFGYSFVKACLHAGGVEELARRFSGDNLVSAVSTGATFGAGAGIIVGVCIGIAGYLTTVAAANKPRGSLARLTGGFLLSVIVSSASVLILIVPIYLGQHLIGAASTSALLGVAISLAVTLGCASRTGDWHSGVIYGVVVGTLFALSVYSIKGTGSPVVGLLLSASSKAVLYCTIFGLGFAFGHRVGGVVAGAAASALSSALAFFAFRLLAVPSTPWMGLAVVMGIISIGLLFPKWISLFLFPFETVWNAVLLQLDERAAAEKGRLLRWNSAFWDEHQRLPLFGLDEHLLLAMENGHSDAQASADYLSNTAQRWAVRKARTEADSRFLASRNSIEDLSHVRDHLKTVGELSPESAIIARFITLSRDVASALNQGDPFNEQAGLIAVDHNLSGLNADLMRSTQALASRFLAASARWSAIVDGHLRQLETSIASRREVRNPYVIGLPLTQHQEVFVGRSQISGTIANVLLADPQPPLLLYGQRRIGKTSLLNNLGRLLPTTVVPMFIDLQGPATKAVDPAGFFYSVSKSMIQSAQVTRQVQLPEIARSAFAEDPFTAFDDWLGSVEQALQHRNGLLALDEFEALDAAISKGRLDGGDVLSSIRHIVQHRPRIKVLLSGTHSLDEMKHWASYLINVQTLHIGYLSEAEAAQLIERPVKNFSLEYEPDATRRICALTRCHPYLVQLLCHQVVTLKNMQSVERRAVATAADVEDAVPVILRRGAFFFFDLENQAGPQGVEVLRRIAARETVDFTGMEEVRDRLLRREMIEPSPEGYRFQVELARLWFHSRERVI